MRACVWLKPGLSAGKEFRAVPLETETLMSSAQNYFSMQMEWSTLLPGPGSNPTMGSQSMSMVWLLVMSPLIATSSWSQQTNCQSLQQMVQESQHLGAITEHEKARDK